ncbi:MAG: NAD(P)-dependent dehydrogenase (short-subunit alcohol dehydrogenase family) [Halobacteriales archaeon]|jgi:NAD(P)-dependent dehydrogenase (short-subunit alcohol dehydrogenase family)
MREAPEAIAGVSDVDCSGLQALVTGSTSGIGRAAALALGRLGADVVVHGRDAQAGAEVVAELSRAGADATFVEADFADVDAVRDLATDVREEIDGLDILVNNAGGLFRNGTLTDAGVGYTFHVNHLSPYLLTADLLDHLREGARIVTTASGAHKGASLDMERVRGADRYTGFKAYSHSKLANVLFAAELARRLDATGREVTANSIHPGAIPGSGFSRFLPGPLPGLFQRLEAIPGVTSVADGAAEILFVALSPRGAEVSGRYFANRQPHTPSEAARDEEAARRLWTKSATLLGIDEPLAEHDRQSVAAGDRTAPGDS